MLSLIPFVPFLGPNLGSYGAGAVTCTNNICVGRYTEVTTTFRRLQALANTAAQSLGIGAPIAVDGKIGPATVARVYLVSTAMPPRPDLPLLTAMPSGLAPQALAANAEAYVAELDALVSGEIQMPVDVVNPPRPSPGHIVSLPGGGATTTPVQTPGVPGAGPHITSSASGPIGEMPTGAKVALGLTLAGALAYVLHRRKKNKAALAPGVAGLFGYRRRRR